MGEVVEEKLEGGIIHTKVYWDDGLSYEHYMLEGKLHGEDGPAYVGYRKDRSIYWKEYWLNGKKYSKEEYKVWLLNKEADEAIHEMLGV